MASAGVFLLLSLHLSSVGSLPPPRTSFLLGSAARPLIHFSLPDIHNTTTLLLSDDESTLYVGARDAILSLDVGQSEVIHLKKKVQWSPSEDEINDCFGKGKNPTVDCPNFVQVLQQLNSTHLYACGSYAYSPHDAYIDAESLSMVHRDGAKGRCPFNPFERNTAVTIDGELFTATTTDFRGVKPQISRYFSKDDRPDVSLDSSVNLLEEPKFVGSSLDPADKKLYFFFSEVGKEFNFVDELRIARVAQVCKDDVGGQRTLQKKWTSFAKAPLLCQSPKQLPFNILQDMFTLQPPEGGSTSETLFYGVFTSQWSTGRESAVCVFKLQDIKTVFTGSYRTFDMNNHQWSPLTETHSYLGKCGLHDSSDSELTEVKKSFLTSSSVRPVDGGPIVVSSEQQYKHVAVMRTQAADGKQYTVMFLLTESGFLHKVGLFDRGPRVIEEIQVFTQPQLVQSIVLSSSKGVLYVGTSEGVTAVPLASCSIYPTCTQCVLARDPLCGWSRTKKLCTGLDGSHENMIQNLENGNVEEECRGETKAGGDTDIIVPLNEVVRLQCVKPSNLATLTWTSSQFTSLPEELFIRLADGSLSFLATSSTFGTYRCEAEEGGYKETVVSYDVRQIAPPRSMSPQPKEDKPLVHESKDEPFEDIPTVTSVVQPSRDKEDSDTKDKEATFAPTLKDETDFSKENPRVITDNSSDIKKTSRTDTQSSPELSNDPPKEKSYYGELVGVSILLAICILILMLGLLQMGRQRKPGLKLDRLFSPDDDGKTNKSLEICSLSSPEDAAPELKVVN
ncbi:semaphorin-4A-like [Amphiprion ocellaris]|uniref:Sema domain-containing protein n=1 Tax=Amphiprion ocellaris TaxID=80972 RepID=A0A3Q1BJB0_AMPOC|nr:semaphorin-4A-like [Amphiprion ocellaris]XP_054869768.1 semaphorin-4A-like [Amphiprion ocellaris]XP_054869769.1 semaphorin-4A-like [Amphiprion ocellaris]XP_054869770.1 semaphorin-4A-like [Amphiprion ocellaris]